MKKTFIVFLATLSCRMFLLGQNVNAVLDWMVEMPAIKGESLSGILTITNQGQNDIKLVNGRSCLVEQVRFFVVLPFSEQERLIGHPLNNIPAGNFSRGDIKESTDYSIDEGKNFCLIKPGKSATFEFDDLVLEFPVLHYANSIIPVRAELYLQPNIWIPIKMPSPLAFDYKTGLQWITSESNRSCAPFVLSDGKAIFDRKLLDRKITFRRATVGTNDFVFTSFGRGAPKRLMQLNKEDMVTHDAKGEKLTIFHKDGGKYDISTSDVDGLIKQRTFEWQKRVRREMDVRNVEILEKGTLDPK